MSRMRCYYEVLQLERNCTADEIKKQYRKMALQWHPDKNVGNEELATKNFKEITTAHAVLINPQERQWYDDHRESILSGGDGTVKSGEGDDPEENLWPYFNAMCYKGFGDGPEGFYGVYRGVFAKLYDDEVSKGVLKSGTAVFSFGSKESSPKEVMDFYAHWSNFVTSMVFGWADVYDVREAPNRIVKRAIEKENKKARDEAKRKYQDKVRALVTFVKGLDPRIVKIESERKKKKVEDDAQRAELRAAEIQAKKELKIRRQQQMENDEEELERRERERSRAYLLADNDDEYNDLHRAATPVDDVEVEGNAKIGAADDFVDHRGATATVPKGDQICYAFQKGLCSRGNECGFRHEMPPETDLSIRLVEEIAKDDNTVQQSDEEGEDFVILRCQICRKDFKSESQLEQHFTSKAHRKKESETRSSSKKLAPVQKAYTIETSEPVDEANHEVSAAAGGLSKKALKKKNKKMQAFVAAENLKSDDDSDEHNEAIASPAPSAPRVVTTLQVDNSSDDDSDD